MITDEQKAELGARLSEMMAIALPEAVDGRYTIGELADADLQVAKSLLASDDALMPVLRTALVINWRESAMVRRYEAFRLGYPEITTLAALKAAIDREEPVAFCQAYLGIRANSAENPKYQLLRELVSGFLEYQANHGLPSEILALRHWAERVDPAELALDPIGKRPGVGIGVVENLRRNLGMSVIKPDRHVIGVVRKVLGFDIPISAYGALADAAGMERRYFDFIAFKYGQLLGISA